MDSFSNPRFRLSCPKCNSTFYRKLSDLNPGKKHRCSSCGIEIHFEGNGAREARKSLLGVERSIKELSRSLKF